MITFFRFNFSLRKRIFYFMKTLLACSILHFISCSTSHFSFRIASTYLNALTCSSLILFSFMLTLMTLVFVIFMVRPEAVLSAPTRCSMRYEVSSLSEKIQESSARRMLFIHRSLIFMPISTCSRVFLNILSEYAINSSSFYFYSFVSCLSSFNLACWFQCRSWSMLMSFPLSPKLFRSSIRTSCRTFSNAF